MKIFSTRHSFLNLYWDISQIFKVRRPNINNWRLFFNYCKITFKDAFLDRLFHFTRENALSLKINFPDYHGFHKLFTDIFIRRSYYFETDKTNPLIIDCGANIGIATLFFKKLYPEAEIIAFEPFPKNCEIFKKNIADNKLTKVALYQKALDDKSGRQILYYSLTKKEHAGNTLQGGLAGIKNLTGQTEVEVVRLSDYATKPVDFLKLDIEGKETAVIRDLAKAKKLAAIGQCIMEFHYHKTETDNDFAEMINYLEKAGFQTLIYQVDPYLNPYEFRRQTRYTYLICAYK